MSRVPTLKEMKKRADIPRCTICYDEVRSGEEVVVWVNPPTPPGMEQYPYAPVNLTHIACAKVAKHCEGCGGDFHPRNEYKESGCCSFGCMAEAAELERGGA
jgi:hypothetical protein